MQKKPLHRKNGVTAFLLLERISISRQTRSYSGKNGAAV